MGYLEIVQVQYWQEQLPKAEIHPISALQNFNIKEVFERIIELLPVAPPYYPKDQLTDRPERFSDRFLAQEEEW